MAAQLDAVHRSTGSQRVPAADRRTERSAQSLCAPFDAHALSRDRTGKLSSRNSQFTRLWSNAAHKARAVRGDSRLFPSAGVPGSRYIFRVLALIQPDRLFGIFQPLIRESVAHSVTRGVVGR